VIDSSISEMYVYNHYTQPLTQIVTFDLASLAFFFLLEAPTGNKTTDICVFFVLMNYCLTVKLGMEKQLSTLRK